MSQVEVRLAAVVEHVDLAVLVGAHRARVDVDVRVELLHPHGEPAALQEHPDRSAGQPFSEGADHPAGHENVLVMETAPDAGSRAGTRIQYSIRQSRLDEGRHGGGVHPIRGRSASGGTVAVRTFRSIAPPCHSLPLAAKLRLGNAGLSPPPGGTSPSFPRRNPETRNKAATFACQPCNQR